MAEITAAQVWQEIEKQSFAVLGMVTAKGASRTVGILYTVRNHRLYIASNCDMWKTRHIAQNGQVSLTIPITKRIPFLPWIKIPAATLTFAGTAKVHKLADVDTEIRDALLRGQASDSDFASKLCVIDVMPQGNFVTYGVGIPLIQMNDKKKARGRVAVAM